MFFQVVKLKRAVSNFPVLKHLVFKPQIGVQLPFGIVHFVMGTLYERGEKINNYILKVPFFGLKIDGKRTGAENDLPYIPRMFRYLLRISR